MIVYVVTDDTNNSVKKVFGSERAALEYVERANKFDRHDIDSSSDGSAALRIEAWPVLT